MRKFDSTRQGNSMRTHAYKELESAIFDGVFAPGASLNEEKLARELGVSRTPVREALVQLEREGLVKTVPNRGAEVIGVSEEDTRDIHFIRTKIEGFAARKASESITEKELNSMREIVELQEFYAGRGDYMQVAVLDTKFHELLYEASRSRPLTQMLSLFHNFIQKSRETTLKAGRAAASTQEHRKIYEALLQRDADAAEQATETHVINVRDSFLNYVREARERQLELKR